MEPSGHHSCARHLRHRLHTFVNEVRMCLRPIRDTIRRLFSSSSDLNASLFDFDVESTSSNVSVYGDLCNGLTGVDAITIKDGKLVYLKNNGTRSKAAIKNEHVENVVIRNETVGLEDEDAPWPVEKEKEVGLEFSKDGSGGLEKAVKQHAPLFIENSNSQRKRLTKKKKDRVRYAGSRFRKIHTKPNPFLSPDGSELGSGSTTMKGFPTWPKETITDLRTPPTNTLHKKPHQEIPKESQMGGKDIHISSKRTLDTKPTDRVPDWSPVEPLQLFANNTPLARDLENRRITTSISKDANKFTSPANKTEEQVTTFVASSSTTSECLSKKQNYTQPALLARTESTTCSENNSNLPNENLRHTDKSISEFNAPQLSGPITPPIFELCVGICTAARILSAKTVTSGTLPKQSSPIQTSVPKKATPSYCKCSGSVTCPCADTRVMGTCADDKLACTCADDRVLCTCADKSKTEATTTDIEPARADISDLFKIPENESIFHGKAIPINTEGIAVLSDASDILFHPSISTDSEDKNDNPEIEAEFDHEPNLYLESLDNSKIQKNPVHKFAEANKDGVLSASGPQYYNTPGFDVNGSIRHDDHIEALRCTKGAMSDLYYAHEKIKRRGIPNKHLTCTLDNVYGTDCGDSNNLSPDCDLNQSFYTVTESSLLNDNYPQSMECSAVDLDSSTACESQGVDCQILAEDAESSRCPTEADLIEDNRHYINLPDAVIVNKKQDDDEENIEEKYACRVKPKLKKEKKKKPNKTRNKTISLTSFAQNTI